MRKSIVILTRSYVDVFRSVPTLALIYLVFFALPGISRSIALPAFWSAVLAICIAESAYCAEVYSSAIRSVRPGQWEASASIGLSRRQTLWRVVLPQAVIPGVAPTINMIIFTIKDTALASLITVDELTLHADSLASQNFQPLKTYMVLLGFYVVITVPAGYLGRLAERKLGGGLGAAARFR